MFKTLGMYCVNLTGPFATLPTAGAELNCIFSLVKSNCIKSSVVASNPPKAKALAVPPLKKFVISNKEIVFMLPVKLLPFTGLK